MLKIEKVTDRISVYDVTVNGTHNFFANGILVHNCQEIDLPVKPLFNIDDENGEIATCILAAVNWGKIKTKHDFERIADLVVRGLDALIDLQSYPVKAAERSAKNRRTLGVGITNFAYWMAKHDLSYQNITKEGLELIDEYAEAWSYYLLKASINLAKERGACAWFSDTKYSLGQLPIDTYKKAVDELVPNNPKMDWTSLRSDLMMYGIRNSTLMALMPCECQSLDNLIALEDGVTKTLRDIIEENSDIDVDAVNHNGIPGTRFKLDHKVKFANESWSDEIYYNGVRATDEITFEDGSVYRFTPNHMLLVNRNNERVWVAVEDLKVDDDICKIE